MACSFIDIAVNLTDEMFEGSYHGKKHHEPDAATVLERSFALGVKKMILTGTTIAGTVL